ncbi:MAG: class I SAM-dependent methyltransferase [Pyrinomonadaceae bacterium]
MKDCSIDERLELAFKEKAKCLVCEHDDSRILGIRGNREYNGADPMASPHLCTQVVECRNCGFIYTDPQIKGVEFLEVEHYNRPEEYQSDDSQGLLQMYKHRINFIKTFKPIGTLLDVGAGKGYFVKVAAESGFRASGIEPSPRFCEFAESHLNLKIFNGYVKTTGELKGKQFDVITMHHVLEHIEEPHDLLEALKEFLNDDGVIYIEVPNTKSLTSKIIDAYFRFKGLEWSSRLSPLHPPFHKYGYNLKSLRYLIKKHNYKVVSSNTFSAFSREFSAEPQTNILLRATRRLVVSIVDMIGNRDMLALVIKK